MRKLALVALMVAGCSSSGSGNSSSSTPTDPRIEVPDLKPTAPDVNGFQIILPKVTGIEGGKDYEYCTWTDKVVDEEIAIKAAQAFQSKTGHHVVLYYTTKKEAPGTQRICRDDDMASFRFVIGAGGEGVADKNELPGDLAQRIPKGAQLVVNAHYLNPGDKTMEAQSAVNVRLVDKGAKYTPAGAMAWLDTTLDVPPNGKHAMDVKCTMTQDVKLWRFIPHMHRWGSHITVDRVKGDSQGERLFDVAWEEGFTFHPPEIRREPTDPLVFNKGDQINVHCEFNNDTSKDLPFGIEMCVAFGQTIDPNGVGNMACDKGSWTDF